MANDDELSPEEKNTALSPDVREAARQRRIAAQQTQEAPAGNGGKSRRPTTE